MGEQVRSGDLFPFGDGVQAMASDKFHDGEVFIQEQTGERRQAEKTAAVMRDTILPAAFDFLVQRESIALASRDADGEIHASLLWGQPGFVAGDHERKFHIDLQQAFREAGDPLWDNLVPGAQVGTLLLDLAHRRRYRLNGEVILASDERIDIAVREGYPNCPKYIQAREVVLGPAEQGAAEAGRSVGDAQRAWLEGADTFLIASGHPQRGLDISHRGGNPGFVQFTDAQTIRVPDYAGNTLYNTLGNLHSDPHVGLLFLDFERGRQLQLTGRAEVHMQAATGGDRTGGTGRWVDIALHGWRESDLPVHLEWSVAAPSPFNPD